MTIQEVSEDWGMGQIRINTLCHESRIKGASKWGWAWVIPKDAEKTKDERIKSSKYIKSSQGDDNELIC